MCTLIALHRRVPGAPLVVAANRDEFHARPAEPPAIRPTAAGATLAPRDARAGGTWLGLSGRGLFAAVTNLRCDDPDPRRRSRGLLVLDVLGEPDAGSAARRLDELGAGLYNPFNLFVADRERAFAFTYRDRPRRVDPADGSGVFVIGNVDPTGPATRKIERLRKGAEQAATASAERVLEVLARVCRSHSDDSPFDSVCVHAGEYGTRSSTLLRLGTELPGFASPESDSKSAFLFAEGAPCTTEYRDLSPLLRDLFVGPDVRRETHSTRTIR